VTVKMTVPNDTTTQQLGQVIQAMTAEAGFDVQLQTTEFATLLAQGQAGNFQIEMVAWSGRVDPDGNLHQFVTCQGGLNDMKYCNPQVDALLNGARAVTDPAERKAQYSAAMKIVEDEKPITYLDFEPRLFGAAKALHGFVPHPDGMIRLQNVTLEK
jgi:peptide/nickel transport system substrate-binding protein